MQHIDTDLDAGPVQAGMVFKKSQGFYAVEVDGRTVECTISSKLRKNLIYPIAHSASVRHRVVDVAGIKSVDPVAIGDLVQVALAEDGSGMITEVLPRKSTLVRRAAGAKPLMQVIAVNVDQVLPVMAAARPALSWELMDRYLAAAEEAGLPSIIIITKMDLVEPGCFDQEVRTYRRIGYDVILTSSATGAGIEELKAALKGHVSVVAGKSGVGKTTLLNTVQPGLGLRVGEVSGLTGKGRHTTSQLEMFGLHFGGAIVDTPGMREFGLWDTSSKRQRLEHEDLELAELFPDLRPYVGQCRFGLDCSHTHEPGCAIKAAVEAGEVAARRYQSYLRMMDR